MRNAMFGILLLWAILAFGCIFGKKSNTQPPPKTAAPVAVVPTTTQPAAVAKPPVPMADAHLGPSPAAAVVINPDLFWATSTCGWPVTPVVRVSVVDGAVRFENHEPGWRHLWLYQQLLQIDPALYPFAVLTYRASGIKAEHYLIWMDDGTGPGNGGLGVFQTKDVINDGVPHEMHVDVRKFKPKGNLRAIWVALHHDDSPEPAFLEILDLRFEADPNELRPPTMDHPFTVQVIDQENRAFPDVSVTLDYEFANWARHGLTNSDGALTLTPCRTPDGVHMARVSKLGYITKDVRGQALSRPIVLERAAFYGGRVVDEIGKAIANAIVRLEVRPNDYWSAQTRIILPWNVQTDARGYWRSPPLPATLESLGVGVVHADYAGDGFNAWHVPAPMNELREFRFTRSLSRGLTVRGSVLDAEGKPVGDARVMLGGREGVMRQVSTDAEGRFEAEHVSPGMLNIKAQKKQARSAGVDVIVTQDMPEVRIQLSSASQPPATGPAVDDRSAAIVAVARYFKAARADDQEAIGKLTDSNKAPARQAAQLRAIEGELIIRQALVSGDRALVITEAFAIKNPSGIENRHLVFTLKQQPDKRWLINDIDAEDQNGLAEEIRRFQQRN